MGCGFISIGPDTNHPISLLSAAPVYLKNDETIDNIITFPFHISNRNNDPSSLYYPITYNFL